MQISLIIPFYNEEKQISLTFEAVIPVLENTGRSWEIVAIDDGSSDNTWQELQKVAEKYTTVRIFHFSRNFGKEAATCAGMDLVTGDAVILMDGDLQHPPTVIPEMLAKWEEGYEVVDGKKSSRGKEKLMSRLNAALFYGSFHKFSGYDLKDASDFKLMDKKVIQAWRHLKETDTFFRALSLWLGFKRTTVYFEVAERTQGKSKWGTGNLIRLSVNAITGFSAKPLYIITGIGAVLMLGFLILGIQTLINYFAGRAASGFTTVILLQLLIGGAVLMSLGLLGIYIGNLFNEIKRRPRYIISEAVNMTTLPEPDSATGSIVCAPERPADAVNTPSDSLP